MKKNWSKNDTTPFLNPVSLDTPGLTFSDTISISFLSYQHVLSIPEM